MITIQKPDASVSALLGRALRKPGQDYRLTHFLLQRETTDGVLFFHTLTCELLLLTKEEAENALSSDELLRRGFVVPTGENEHDRVASIRRLFKKAILPPEEILSYRIFTTLSCNARCFYCFEHGMPQCTMTPETAEKTARFMVDHCNGKKIQIIWFGGEPLCNTRVIDNISQTLNTLGVQYASEITTNASLITDEIAEKTAGLWHIQTALITLDGTEEVYNRVKAYVGPKMDNPFQTVICNIEKLLDKGIHVTIRLNVNEQNADDLSALIDFLRVRFGERKNLSVYTYMLFQLSEADSEERERVAAQNDGLRLKLRESPLNASLSAVRLPVTIRQKSCCADSGSYVCVLPDGKLALCDTYARQSIIGDLDSYSLSGEMADTWSECIDEKPECATCALYPQCRMLKKCIITTCYDSDRRWKTENLTGAMEAAYRNYLQHQPETEDHPEKTPEPDGKRDIGNRPLSLAWKFVTEPFHDFIAVMAVTDRSEKHARILKVNKAGLAILNHLQTKITRDELVKTLAEEYRAPEHQVAASVDTFITQLNERGMLG